MTGIPWSFTAHRYDLEADHLLARKARHAAFVRVISEHGRSLAVRCGVPADRLVTLHMGVALPPPARVPGPQRAFRVLVPARLEAVKNHELILQAWARVRTPAELCLAGDGPLRAAVERRAAALGLRGVRLLGGLPHEALLDLYRCGAVDAALLASHVEGIPVALMEAMSFGLPAVCTEVGGVAELLGRGAGVLVAAGDAAALAEALEALARQPLRRQALGSAGRRRVAAAFRLDTIAAALARRFAAGAAQPETGTRGSEARAGAPSRLAATTVRRAS